MVCVCVAWSILDEYPASQAQYEMGGGILIRTYFLFSSCQ